MRRMTGKAYRLGKGSDTPEILGTEYWLNEISRSTGIAIDQFRELSEFLEEKLKEHQKDISNTANEELSGKDLTQSSIFWEKYINFKDVYPPRVRAGLFLTIYSLMETLLKECCEKVFDTDSKVKVTDLKGHSIEQIKNYLTKVACVELPFFLSSNEFACLRLLRNAFVHNHGIMESKKHQSYYEQSKKINQFKGVRFDEYTNKFSVILEPDFLGDVTARIDSLFNELNGTGQKYIKELDRLGR